MHSKKLIVLFKHNKMLPSNSKSKAGKLIMVGGALWHKQRVKPHEASKQKQTQHKQLALNVTGKKTLALKL